MRMLDDVYGADQDTFPLEQEARWRISRLEWDDDAEDGAEELWAIAADVRIPRAALQNR